MTSCHIFEKAGGNAKPASAHTNVPMWQMCNTKANHITRFRAQLASNYADHLISAGLSRLFAETTTPDLLSELFMSQHFAPRFSPQQSEHTLSNAAHANHSTSLTVRSQTVNMPPTCSLAGEGINTRRLALRSRRSAHSSTCVGLPSCTTLDMQTWLTSRSCD